MHLQCGKMHENNYELLEYQGLHAALKPELKPNTIIISKWIFCRSPAKVQKFILPVTDFFMLDVRVRVRVWVRI